MTLCLLPSNALADETIPPRIAGVNAVQTAIQIADQSTCNGSVILASAAPYGMVDALTAGPLGSYLNAPILLQDPGSGLNNETKEEIKKLNAKTVYVTSGTAVIQQTVLDELNSMDITVVQLGGSDRFETSANIANTMIELGASVNKVAVAYGWLNQDALSIAPIASAQNQPILLTETNNIPDCIKEFLVANKNVVSTTVIGGTAVISEKVKSLFPEAVRYFGNTAYDTNVAVLKAFEDFINYDHIFIANGQTGIDALAGAPLAAQYKAGIVLTNGSANEGTAYASTKLSADSVITALGGMAVVPEGALADLITARNRAINELMALAYEKQQAVLNKIDGIVFGGDASAITVEDLKVAVLDQDDVITANLEAYQEAISKAADRTLKSNQNVQFMVTCVNSAQATLSFPEVVRTAAIARIDGIKQGGDASGIMVHDLIETGVPEEMVLENNLEAYQAAISGASDYGLDCWDDIYAMVKVVNSNQKNIS